MAACLGDSMRKADQMYAEMARECGRELYRLAADVADKDSKYKIPSDVDAVLQGAKNKFWE